MELAARFWARQPGGSQRVKEQQDEGQLFGVWSQGEHIFRYPDFQFDLAGQVRPEVPRLLRTMEGNPAWMAKEDPSGWQRALWLYQPRRSLSRQVVAFRTGKQDPIPTDPAAAAAFLLTHVATSTPEEVRPRSPAEVFATESALIIALVRDYAEHGEA
ncbi:MAG: hypothetical protein B7X39_20905 [Lysobacterales bacterium 14-68-21]|jgi:hypothetical protein|nr:MAG: hypothetical protein B7X39_20905 [Xanthomonadales bacterium 14-68-21]